MRRVETRPSCGLWLARSRYYAVIKTDLLSMPAVTIDRSEAAARRYVKWLDTHHKPTIVVTEQCRSDYLPALALARGMPIITIPLGVMDDLCAIAAWKRCPPKKKAAMMARMADASTLLALLSLSRQLTLSLT